SLPPAGAVAPEESSTLLHALSSGATSLVVLANGGTIQKDKMTALSNMLKLARERGKKSIVLPQGLFGVTAEALRSMVETAVQKVGTEKVPEKIIFAAAADTDAGVGTDAQLRQEWDALFTEWLTW